MADKTTRILMIYSRLRRGPVTIEILKDWALSNDIFISERSLYRDLKEIEKIVLLDNERVVVTEGEKNRKTWKIEFNSASNALNDNDLTTYALFKNFAPLSLTKAQEESLHKFESFFYSYFSKSHFEDKAGLLNFQISATHFYENTDSKDYRKVLADTVWSIQNQRELIIKRLDFDYTSIPKSIDFPLSFLPVQLLYHRGEIHLVGFTKQDNIFLVIAIEQLTDYKLTNEMFSSKHLQKKLKDDLSRRFGITENIDNRVYDIEIEFSEMTGFFMKNIFWHQSQKFKRLKNGNHLLSMKCGINRELVGWIFQWMSNAKVIKPQILKDAVRNKLEDIFELYREEKSLVSNNSFRSN